MLGTPHWRRSNVRCSASDGQKGRPRAGSLFEGRRYRSCRPANTDRGRDAQDRPEAWSGARRGRYAASARCAAPGTPWLQIWPVRHQGFELLLSQLLQHVQPPNPSARPPLFPDRRASGSLSRRTRCLLHTWRGLPGTTLPGRPCHRRWRRCRSPPQGTSLPPLRTGTVWRGCAWGHGRLAPVLEPRLCRNPCRCSDGGLMRSTRARELPRTSSRWSVWRKRRPANGRGCSLR